MGGIGKSTLAAQVATRVGRLQSGRVIKVINGELSVPHLASAEGPARAASSVPVTGATVARDRAAAWAAGQVSRAADLACDPAMCAALARHGVKAGSLLVLGPGAGDPLGSDVVLEIAAVRAIFGGRLAGVYAPEVLASFGADAPRIDIRLVAPDGAAAYRTALAADVRARRAAGAPAAARPADHGDAFRRRRARGRASRRAC